MLRSRAGRVNARKARAAAALPALEDSPVKISNHAISFRALAALVTALAAGCAPLPQQPGGLAAAQRSEPPGRALTVAVEWRASPNADSRRPNYVVIHHTSNGNVEDALRTLTDPARRVSSHYLIGRDGQILQLVDDRERAWHAGESYWGGLRDMNSASIGIELDNDGREPFAAPMIDALLALLRDIDERFNIPTPNFIGHGDIAPGRKVDPSVLFPWRRLAAEGYGLWCDPPYPSAPPGVDTALMLQAFGYDVTRLDAAIAAFKRHFVPDDPSPLMNEKDRSVLYCLVSQKQSAGQ
jgi:N-acetylmuramoyl-L-alanine amidase